ncbi:MULTISPECIES: hypothetical protein [unclassified Cryobacterium]|uniref:hypothetical protein n=1 Tax=unclassified Cryobacterium TaxID=2649013 RepID=UPI002B231993|nr:MULTISPECIES: hypothetical protein [unclassified Cryobacterium]MEA9997840.1 hypothetical protein [Cryobacterium sp. RTS3]MEB0264361.1 hypothetical protein [Cryobacterium sp. 10I5]
MSDWTKTRSKIAHTIKKNPSADTTELRRQLKAERLEEHVARVVASAPPLTPEQRDRIAALLRPSVGASA